MQARIARGISEIERSSPIDAVADPLHDVLAATAVPDQIRDWLSGTPLGHPMHPFLVSVPIGCWTSAAVLDALGRRRSAQTLVGVGVLAVLPTALSGLSDWLDTSGAERRVGFVHLATNTVATAVYAKSWLARRADRHMLGVTLGILGAAVATAGGWLGGHLAYSLGVGVDTNAFSAGPVEWSPLDLDGRILDNRPARSAVGPTAVLLSRQDDGVKVIADRCSHRGGPLSDGEVSEGCVTCPWHGSRFDLTTGEVRRGPAVVPQPVYEVRETGDTIEVRRDEPRALRTNTTQP
jgi:nitrite reductase/ring-hydroxylating ferredoxin subunit/uncharacterized membrane protein